MMKKKIRIFIILLLLFITSAAFVLAAEYDSINSDMNITNEPVTLSSNSSYSGYAYLIDSYDINIVVQENNVFNISEKIGAYFNVPRHGIIRKIPLENKVERLDGTTSHNRVKISDIRVDSTYATSVSGGEKIIKIGDSDTTITGAENYKIDYVYNIGKDTGKSYDEFYFNLIGKEWDTAIGNINFSIIMPKEFDESKLGFSTGPSGSSESSNIIYQVEGNEIKGRYDGILNSGEALTVRLELPDGYFTHASNNFDYLTILSFVLPILFMLFSVFMWIKFGKDEKVVETVEFYPPEGFNSAEIGFLYKGKAENNDVISLLIYLANKGYIKISDREEHSLFVKSKAFKLTKLKDYDGDNQNERIFLTGLFNTRKNLSLADLAGLFKSKKIPKVTDIQESREEVLSEDLQNSFYITLNKIIKNLNSTENKQKIYERNSLTKGLLFAVMIILIYILITVKPVVEYGGISALPFALLFPGIGFTVLFGMVFGKTKIPVKIFGFVWGMGFGGAPWVLMVFPALQADFAYMAAYILGLACVFIMTMMYKVMPKRTAYGNELLGKIEGFRAFLETAEKPKLEELVLNDPAYFYNILPYTYVLGVSDKWIEKFEVIALQAPDWYDGSTAFNTASFGAFMGSTMSAATAAMSSSPSGSGGGSSGGGSSGGGSGGGGGSSW